MIHETRTSYVVLVVDDSPDSLRFLTDALDSAGMTVLVATDGEEALVRVQEIRPDVIFAGCIDAGSRWLCDLPADQGKKSTNSAFIAAPFAVNLR